MFDLSISAVPAPPRTPSVGAVQPPQACTSSAPALIDNVAQIASSQAALLNAFDPPGTVAEENFEARRSPINALFSNYALPLENQIENQVEPLSDVNFLKQEIWRELAIGGHVTLIKNLLENGVGADIVNSCNDRGETALSRAAACGQADVVALLLKLKGIDRNRGCPLKRAAEEGHHAIFLQLLSTPCVQAGELIVMARNECTQKTFNTN